MEKARRQILRQGDVLLVATDKRPSATAKAVTDNGRVILAYGEVTGHAHQVVAGPTEPLITDHDPVPAMELFEETDGTRLLVVKRDALLKHEEHGPITLAPGGYEVIRQREYEPAGIRNVAD